MGSMHQDRIFLDSEGNHWFERNLSALENFDAEKDLPLKVIELYQLKPRRVLEIGGANGCRLAAIRARYGAERLVVVEPSSKAIHDGRSRYRFIKFVRGVACDIPLRESFDLIITNFTFHWIDRTSLLKSVAEIDRLVADRGFLIIGDFLPSNRFKVTYHHLPEHHVFTYKQDYSAPVLASGLYRLVCMLSGDHASKVLGPDVEEAERIGLFLLQKTGDSAYVERKFAGAE
jgi:SAM-dependent methyltransferase